MRAIAGLVIGNRPTHIGLLVVPTRLLCAQPQRKATMSRGSLRRVYDDNSALLTEMKSTERYKRAVERMQKESHGSTRPGCSRRWRSGRSASAQLRKPLKHHRDIGNLGHLHAPRREAAGRPIRSRRRPLVSADRHHRIHTFVARVPQFRRSALKPPVN